MAAQSAEPLLSPMQKQFFDDNGALSALRSASIMSPHLAWHSNIVRHIVHNSAGYLVLDDFATQDEVAKLKQRAEQIIDDYDASNPSVFSTVNQAI
jgi:hypothetical protein